LLSLSWGCCPHQAERGLGAWIARGAQAGAARLLRASARPRSTKYGSLSFAFWIAPRKRLRGAKTRRRGPHAGSSAQLAGSVRSAGRTRRTQTGRRRGWAARERGPPSTCGGLQKSDGGFGLAADAAGDAPARPVEKSRDMRRLRTVRTCSATILSCHRGRVTRARRARRTASHAAALHSASSSSEAIVVASVRPESSGYRLRVTTSSQTRRSCPSRAPRRSLGASGRSR